MRSPKIKIDIRAILTDQSGKIVKRYPWKRANSLLKTFIQILMALFSQTAQTITNTAGAGISTAAHAAILKTNATSETTYGIVIGTGTAAVAMTDYKLATQVTASITHGTPSFAVENPDASTWRVAISRAFTNNAGTTLNVTEVGLYVSNTGTGYFHCIDRTLYSVAVPSTVTLTLTYRITVSL